MYLYLFLWLPPVLMCSFSEVETLEFTSLIQAGPWTVWCFPQGQSQRDFSRPCLLNLLQIQLLIFLWNLGFYTVLEFLGLNILDPCMLSAPYFALNTKHIILVLLWSILVPGWLPKQESYPPCSSTRWTLLTSMHNSYSTKDCRTELTSPSRWATPSFFTVCPLTLANLYLNRSKVSKYLWVAEFPTADWVALPGPPGILYSTFLSCSLFVSFFPQVTGNASRAII